MRLGPAIGRAVAIGCCLTITGGLLLAGAPAQAQTPAIYTGMGLRGYPEHDAGGGSLPFPELSPALADFEDNIAGKGVSIVEWWQTWYENGPDCSNPQPTYSISFMRGERPERVRQHGSIPMINWGPINVCSRIGGEGLDGVLAFRLAHIANGDFDGYLDDFAREAAAWGKPFFLVFASEMNGSWKPWGYGEKPQGCAESPPCNTPQDYVRAWRHVHDIFVKNGATNAIWVWNVDPTEPYVTYLNDFYPGDDYVDWVGFSQYNWGPGMPWGSAWRWTMQMLPLGYRAVNEIAPSKPVVLTEFASSEIEGNRADWIRDAFGWAIPNQFPNIKAVVYSQFYDPPTQYGPYVEWRIWPNTASAAAFRQTMALDIYGSNSFATLEGKPPVGPNLRVPNIQEIQAPGRSPGGATWEPGPLTTVGGVATIRGWQFGDYPPTKAVTLSNPHLLLNNTTVAAEILEWSDTRITIRVPENVVPGSNQLVVWGPGGPSGPYTTYNNKPRLDINPRAAGLDDAPPLARQLVAQLLPIAATAR